MKTTRKYIAVLALAAAGSVFLGTSPTLARGRGPVRDPRYVPAPPPHVIKREMEKGRPILPPPPPPDRHFRPGHYGPRPGPGPRPPRPLPPRHHPDDRHFRPGHYGPKHPGPVPPPPPPHHRGPGPRLGPGPRPPR